MTRLYNRETVAVLILGFVAIIIISLLAELGRISLLLVAVWLVLVLPVAMKVQYAVIPLYLSLGFYQRALDLTIDIRESAPNRKKRDLASLDVALVQAAMGRFKESLKTLEGIKEESFGKPARALILANRAWCRAHLGIDLEKALEEARKARELDPNESLLSYFEGLVLHKTGDHLRAVELISKSLEADSDLSLPTHGERVLIRGDAFEALGKVDDARKDWTLAKKQSSGKGPLATLIDSRMNEG